jgi:hypothetical protein
MTGRPADVPLFEVTSGATAAEIAAVAAVLAAVVAAAQTNPAPAGRPTAASGWADRSRLLRTPLAHVPGGWRASARPV